jgi:6-pyruvoyltetrahydropterin/6-carboxytetrahydropterin synthase
MERLLYTAAAGFESARHVPALPAGHRLRGIHGHGFVARVRCALPGDWAAFPGAEVGQLRDALAAAVRPLDYALLNAEIEVPTDENIARWVRQRLDVPGIEQVGVQSTRDEGVDLDNGGRAHVWRRYAFESAHRLPHVPPGHKCGRMHGHGFEVIVHAEQALGEHAPGIDHDHIDASWAPLGEELGYACLNDIPGLENPTSELISSWLWARLKPALPELSCVTVYETGSCGAHFDGENYRIWKDMTLDSAVRLAGAPEGDRRRRVHGHTYTLRLHLHAPLDTILGWTVDFGDVRSAFDPLFRQLDHAPLYDLPGMRENDTASLARWIRDRAASHCLQFDRIDLYETRGCGVILSLGELGAALPV